MKRQDKREILLHACDMQVLGAVRDTNGYCIPRVTFMIGNKRYQMSVHETDAFALDLVRKADAARGLANLMLPKSKPRRRK